MSEEFTKFTFIDVSSSLNNERYSDYQIVLPVLQKTIHAHRIILAGASEFFKTLFETCLSDSGLTQFEFQSSRTEMDARTAEEAFESILQLIYTMDITAYKEPTSDQYQSMLNVLLLSDEFQMPHVMYFAAGVLSQFVNLDNCFYFLSLPDVKSMVPLKEAVLKFYKANRDELLSHASISHLPYDLLIALLVSQNKRSRKQPDPEKLELIFTNWSKDDETLQEKKEQFFKDAVATKDEDTSCAEEINLRLEGSFTGLEIASKEMRVLFLGLDASGKTSALYKLKLDEVVVSIPTIGFNVETVDYKGYTLTIWDVGGQEKLRSLWRHYFANTSLVVFFVDSNDAERLDEAKDMIQKALFNEELEEVPVLVYANKQDLPSALSVSQISDRLGLNELTRPWYIQASCVMSGEGLWEGIDWAVNSRSSL